MNYCWMVFFSVLFWFAACCGSDKLKPVMLHFLDHCCEQTLYPKWLSITTLTEQLSVKNLAQEPKSGNLVGVGLYLTTSHLICHHISSPMPLIHHSPEALVKILQWSEVFCKSITCIQGFGDWSDLTFWYMQPYFVWASTETYLSCLALQSSSRIANLVCFDNWHFFSGRCLFYHNLSYLSRSGTSTTVHWFMHPRGYVPIGRFCVSN